MREYIPVPKVFHSFATGMPFQQCKICEKNLLLDGTQYVIEKAIKRYPGYEAQDVMFEYAMCMGCLTDMHKAISEESVKLTSQYFESRVNLAERRGRLLREAGLRVEAWLSHCLLTGHSQEELDDFHLYAHCDGGDLLFTYLPYLISAQAIDELAGSLSVQTKDILDDFIDQHFGVPPELRKMLKNGVVALV